jgi:limonene-1,2-epoxide hydrolase
MAANSDWVKAFIAAWEARDLEGILGRMTADATYLNVGLSEAKGHEAIRATITPFLMAATAVRWTITHIAETPDGVVLTERVDEFVIGEKTLSIPVMGAFEFEGELISAWRDYFDLPGFQAQMT